jgi:hypothetical protein
MLRLQAGRARGNSRPVVRHLRVSLILAATAQIDSLPANLATNIQEQQGEQKLLRGCFA